MAVRQRLSLVSRSLITLPEVPKSKQFSRVHTELLRAPFSSSLMEELSIKSNYINTSILSWEPKSL